MNNIRQKLKELWHYLKAEFIPEQKKRLKILVYQPRLLIFIGIILLINMSFDTSGFGIGIYLFVQTPLTTFILLLIALSNPIEWLFRKLEDVRHVATEKEKSYLIPLFEEVYRQSKKHCKTLSNNIKLYIVDSMNIEAFSIGRNTIVITHGLMETMSTEELKGILAHEFSHIALYHSQIRLVITVVTGTYLWLVILSEKILKKLMILLGDNIISSFTNIVRLIFVFIININFAIANLIILFGYRKAEYMADKTVVDIGYGEPLKAALYKMYDIEITDKKDLMQRIHTTHPRTAYRIEKIEGLLTEHL